MHHRRHLLTPASLPHHRTAGSYWCWWCWCVYLQQRENGLGGEQLRGDGVWVQVKQNPQAATGGIVQMQIRLYCVRHVFLFTLLLTIATIFYSSSSSSSSSSSTADASIRAGAGAGAAETKGDQLPVPALDADAGSEGNNVFDEVDDVLGSLFS